MSEQTETVEIPPTHVAIIMDGNRRWATQRGLAVELGHREGFKRFKEIADYAFDLGIKYLTFYAFSTENWRRTKEEVSGLMSLARFVIEKELPKYKDRDTRVRVIGHRADWPADIAEKIAVVEHDTANHKANNLNIAFSYGGQTEIVEAVKTIIEAGEEVSVYSISRHVYTAGQPNPDMVIRTGGQPRLSNFLMWQSGYSEIYLSDTLWPDFSKKEFDNAITFYHNIKRNFGK
jgi:undecaprenyl diphosphate synthase